MNSLYEVYFSNLSSKVFSGTPGQACYLIITCVFVPLQNARLKTHYSPADIGFDDFKI